MADLSDAGGADAEMATIEQRIRDDRAGYFGDSVMQARYASLIEAREQQGLGLSGQGKPGSAAARDAPPADTARPLGPPPDTDGVRWHNAAAGREIFAATREGQQLLAEWGRGFPAQFASLQHEAASLLGSLPAAERNRVTQWFDSLSPKTRMSWFRTLSRAGQGRRR